MATDPKRLAELERLGRETNERADQIQRDHDQKVAERYEREGRHLETLNERLDRVAPIAPSRGRR